MATTQTPSATTQRLEAFSDGVIAIAITLLVLQIRVPHVKNGSLLDALLHQWPSYVAFVISFVVIGIMWVSHHSMFEKIARRRPRAALRQPRAPARHRVPALPHRAPRRLRPGGRAELAHRGRDLQRHHGGDRARVHGHVGAPARASAPAHRRDPGRRGPHRPAPLRGRPDRVRLHHRPRVHQRRSVLRRLRDDRGLLRRRPVGARAQSPPRRRRRPTSTSTPSSSSAISGRSPARRAGARGPRLRR